jgi:hypothetical protein
MQTHLNKKEPMTKITRTAITALSVVMLSLSAAPAFAEDGSGGTSGNDGSSASATSHETEIHKTVQTAVDQHQENKQQTLADRQEKFCTNKRRVVGNILTHIANRGQRQIDVFTKIADRTEKFKTDKNLIVDNYDALVTTVNDKKTAALNTINKIKTDATAASSLSCDTGQPKAIIGGFKDDLKAENSALKDYKTAIKNLIVAVKSSKSTTEHSTTDTTEAQ